MFVSNNKTVHYRGGGVAIFDLKRLHSSPAHRIAGQFSDFVLGTNIVITLSTEWDPDPHSICVWSYGAALECILRIDQADPTSRIYVASGAVLAQVKSYLRKVCHEYATGAAALVADDTSSHLQPLQDAVQIQEFTNFDSDAEGVPSGQEDDGLGQRTDVAVPL